MGRGGLIRTKRPELHERYDKQPQPKPTRNIFRNRVIQYGYSKEQAITNERYIFQAKRMQHITRDENGRVCNKCKQYKPRDEYAKNKVGFRGKCGSCKECKNKEHREYRLNGGKEKDCEYRYKRRHLDIGEQIYFNGQIREVIGYKYNRGYTVKSITSDETRRIDTGDNKLSTKTNCVKFTKLKEKVEFVIEEEKEEEKPKFEISLDPDEDDEEYYY